MQELALPEFQGENGLEEIVKLLDQGFQELGTNVGKAGVSDFRKLYHTGWKKILEAMCERDLQETLTDRFKSLVF